MPPGSENGNVANSEDRAFRRGGDRSPQSRGRHRKPDPAGLARRIPGRPRRLLGRRRIGDPAGSAGAAGGAADHCLCEQVREFGKARRRHRQIGAQERPQADHHRHGGSRSCGAHLRQEARFHRRHLGRGRSAGARHAGLQRADGRGRAAPRRRRVRRAGARRHGLCGILRGRQEDRRKARGPRRQARR